MALSLTLPGYGDPKALPLSSLARLEVTLHLQPALLALSPLLCRNTRVSKHSYVLLVGHLSAKGLASLRFTLSTRKMGRSCISPKELC